MPFEDHDYPQVIPTPEWSAPGGPSPWAALSKSQRSQLTLELVESRLREAGRHFDVASPPREPAELALVHDADARAITRRSAVLVALFEEDGETRVVLTRRSFELSSHRGEVALPGGRLDAGETESDAALREAVEETGLDAGLARVIGWLSPIVTFASGSSIQPIVAVLSERPVLRANPGEVERVFDVALSDLMADGHWLEQRWRRASPRPGADADGSFPIYFFKVPGEVVWGATGRILTELCSLVAGVPWPSPRWVVG